MKPALQCSGDDDHNYLRFIVKGSVEAMVARWCGEMGVPYLGHGDRA